MPAARGRTRRGYLLRFASPRGHPALQYSIDSRSWGGATLRRRAADEAGTPYGEGGAVSQSMIPSPRGKRFTKKRADESPLFSPYTFFYPSRLSSPLSLTPCSGILAISVRYRRRKKASVTASEASSARGKHHQTRLLLPLAAPYRAST